MEKKRDVVVVIDVGTSSAKLALVDFEGKIIEKVIREYSYSIPQDDHVELDFEIVWQRVVEGLTELSLTEYSVCAVGLSVLCPGLVPLDNNGIPLRPAIIHLDRRSVREAIKALDSIGSERFLSVAANLPYPGGMSVTSILWIKEHEPDIYRRTHMFGHTNTFILKRLTGEWRIDPSNASFIGLYNTIKASTWDLDIITDLALDHNKVPPIFPSGEVAGKISREASEVTNITSGTPVVTGAGDTACAALGAGIVNEGDIL